MGKKKGRQVRSAHDPAHEAPLRVSIKHWCGGTKIGNFLPVCQGVLVVREIGIKP